MMRFWCRQCQSSVGVRVPEWRVNSMGCPNAGGACDRCGDEVLRRITKVVEAPSDIATAATAASKVYRHWQKERTRERDQQLRTLAILFRADREVVDKLAAGFGLQRDRVRLIIREG